MKFSDVKTKKDVMKVYAEGPEVRRKFLEPKRVDSDDIKTETSLTDKKKTRTIKEVAIPTNRAERKLERLEMQHEKMQRKYGAKLKTEELKAKIAEMKEARRKASPLSKIGRVWEKAKSTGDRKGMAQYEVAKAGRLRQRVSLEDLRAREEYRKRMEGETEYQRKFGTRQAGEGELPYYEPEHKRQIPIREGQTIGITNGHRIPKKKDLKDELF
jgi:hypothetical protein